MHAHAEQPPRTSWRRLAASAALVPVLLAALVLVAPVHPAAASVEWFWVDTTNDSVDANPGDGICADLNGACSLRAAIMESNALGAGLILLPEGTYQLTIPGTHENEGATGDLDITAWDVVILGVAEDGQSIVSDESSVIIDGNGLDRVFDFHAGYPYMEGLTITGGAAPPDEAVGGGIRSFVTLTLTNVYVVGNSAIADNSGDGIARGGGVYASFFNPDDGTVRIANNRAEGPVAAYGGGVAARGSHVTGLDFQGVHTSIESNVVASPNLSRGGGMYLGPGPLADGTIGPPHYAGDQIFAGTGEIRENRAEGPNGEGGGIALEDTDHFQHGVVVAGNEAVRGGGIAHFGGFSQVWGDVHENTATERGGGVYVSGGEVAVTDGVVGNHAGSGGGISVVDGLLLVSGHLHANVATVAGGAIEVRGLDAAVDMWATLSANAALTGGAVHVSDGAMLRSIWPSTISGNTAEKGSAITFASDAGVSAIRQATITDNSSSVGAAVEVAAGAGVSITQSVVGAQASGADCNAGVMWVETGFDLDSDGSCGFAGVTDRPSADPLLGPLTDNGGDTPTHLPAAGSPLVNAGGTACSGGDQRQVSRPRGLFCDIGAVELFAAGNRDVAALLDAPEEVVAGSVIPIVASVRNDEPGTTTRPQLLVQSTGEHLVSHDPVNSANGVHCGNDVAGSPVQLWCSWPEAAADATQTLTAHVQVDPRFGQPLGQLERTVRVASLHGDPNTANNTITQNVAVTYPNPDVADAPQGHLFEQPIWWAMHSGVSIGFTDGTFGTNHTVTRLAAMAWLWRLAGEPVVACPDGDFTDVAPHSQFYDAVCWAAATGITLGYTDGTFRPTADVTRQAFIAWLWRLAGQPEADCPTAFTDVDDAHLHYGAICWAAANTITTGYPDGTFKPATSITRGQAMTFLYRSSQHITTLTIT